MKILYGVLFLPGFLLFSADLYAQLTVEGYLDIGQNNISEGFNSQLYNICLFEKTKWGVQGIAIKLRNIKILIMSWLMKEE